MSTTTKANLTQPALFGGLAMGVLSALPLVSAGNICCCLWVVGGGVLAAYLLQQNQSAPIAPGDGALVGLFAGLIGAGIYLVLSIPVTLVMSPFVRAIMQRVAESEGMPPAVRDYLSQPAGVAAQLILGFIFMIVAGAIFSTLGGLLGAVIFRKSPPPAGLADAPPPALMPQPPPPIDNM